MNEKRKYIYKNGNPSELSILSKKRNWDKCCMKGIQNQINFFIDKYIVGQELQNQTRACLIQIDRLIEIKNMRKL